MLNMFVSVLAVFVKHGVEPEGVFLMACQDLKEHMRNEPLGDQLLTALAARALTELAGQAKHG